MTTNQTSTFSMNRLEAQGWRFQKRTWTSSPQRDETFHYLLKRFGGCEPS